MILTINIENTNTIIGCSENSEFIFVESISTNTSRTELEYAISLKNIFELHFGKRGDCDWPRCENGAEYYDRQSGAIRE